MIQGERRYPGLFGSLRLPDGGYGQDMKGRWWCRPPGAPTVALQAGVVTEHADGTITVLGVVIGKGEFIGRLVAGTWSTGGLHYDEEKRHNGEEHPSFRRGGEVARLLCASGDGIPR